MRCVELPRFLRLLYHMFFNRMLYRLLSRWFCHLVFDLCRAIAMRLIATRLPRDFVVIEKQLQNHSQAFLQRLRSGYDNLRSD
jgi:hypothetical protein